MGVEISTVENGTVLAIRYSAEPVQADDLAAQRHQIADAMARHDIRGVLVDASALPALPDPLTLIEHHDQLASVALYRETRCVVVCCALGEDERFLEDSAVNRGLNLKCFIAMDEALAWLLR